MSEAPYDYAAKGRADAMAGRRDETLYATMAPHGEAYRNGHRLARIGAEPPKPAETQPVAAPTPSDAPPWVDQAPLRQRDSAPDPSPRETESSFSTSNEDAKTNIAPKSPEKTRKPKPAAPTPPTRPLRVSSPDFYPPSSPGKVVFVGQGPNRAAWERGLAFGRLSDERNAGAFAGCPDVQAADAKVWASSYCARIAVTGAIGKRLADLAGFPFNIKFGGYARRNLNARFNGKEGKGDVFDRGEGLTKAGIMLEYEDFTHYVLLGHGVARCFEVRAEFLEMRRSKNDAKGFWRHFLVFPHPSGISTWWNDDFNRFRARKRLREFLALE